MGPDNPKRKMAEGPMEALTVTRLMEEGMVVGSRKERMANEFPEQPGRWP